MARGRHYGGVAPIGSVLGGLGAIRVPPSVDVSPVAERDWEAAVGSRIARRARPFKLERGVLHVRAATSTWAQELSLLSDAILEQLRGRGVNARSLRFVVGAIDVQMRPMSRDVVHASPAPVPLPPDVAALVALVPDDELREAIAKAAGTNLGWQRARAKQRQQSNAKDRDHTQLPRGRSAPATSTQPAAPDPRPAERGTARRGRSSPR